MNDLLTATVIESEFDEFIESSENKSKLEELKFYNNLASSKTVDSLKHKVLIVIEKFGFSDFLFCVPGIGGAGFITTLPAEIHVNLLDSCKSNFLIDYCRKSTSPVFLSSIVAFTRSAPVNTEAFQRCDEFFSAMEHYDYHDCYVMSNRSHIGNINALFLVADKGSSVDEFHHKVNCCCTILHLFGEAVTSIGTGSFAPFFSNVECESRIAISPAPLRLLNILAKDNVNLKNAALKLDISIDTASKHIAAAKSTLGAHTQATAVYRAMKFGLIDVDENF